MAEKSVSKLPDHWQVWYQEWNAGVPENDKNLSTQGELLDKPGSQQSYSAAFELFLFSIFNKMGLNVVFQPEINGVNPDFYISDERGCGTYVEAGVMFNSPLVTELSYISMAMPIWEEFKKLQSQDFSVNLADSSGHPGNVSPKSVRHKVQQWIDQLDTAEVHTQRYHGILPNQTFQFENWRLDVELDLKSPEDKERLGPTAVDLAGFSGGWSDIPANRLRYKLEKKSSQVRKTRSHCIVAITGSQEGFWVDDVQTALFGGNSEYNLSPYVKGLFIPQPKSDGLWSPHDAKEPIAVIVHRGNLQYPDDGETELWLNPNSSYFRVPLPLFSLSVHAAEQKVWTRPATSSPTSLKQRLAEVGDEPTSPLP